MSSTLISQHYGSDSLVASVQAALASAGFAAGPVAWEVLAPLDQFHVGGAAATRDLADRLGIESALRLLDVGCGLGGPSRHLAAAYGCDVTGIDINAPFVELATFLTERCGLAAKARFLLADATDIPLASVGFDFAFSQHVAMNVADRVALYGEIRRLLVPGGRFAMYDVVAGDESPIHFPVPWARHPAASFVFTADGTRSALEDAGFDIVEWRDATAEGMAWQQAQVVAGQERPDPLKRLGLPLVMGPQFGEMVANLGRNFREGRLRLLQAVAQRPH
jgi:SAM-dependent methyltransferase